MSGFNATPGKIEGLYEIDLYPYDSVESTIIAANYYWFNNDVSTKKFPDFGKLRSKHNLAIVCFGRPMSPFEVEKALELMGHRPAIVDELLALGVQHPYLQLLYPIAALGSICIVYGKRHVPCLFRDGMPPGSKITEKRCLGLEWYIQDWFDYFRFAAIPL